MIRTINSKSRGPRKALSLRRKESQAGGSVEPGYEQRWGEAAAHRDERYLCEEHSRH